MSRLRLTYRWFRATAKGSQTSGAASRAVLCVALTAAAAVAVALLPTPAGAQTYEVTTRVAGLTETVTVLPLPTAIALLAALVQPAESVTAAVP